MKTKKKNKTQIITVYIAQTKQYENALDRMIKKMERLIYLEEKFKSLLR